MEQVLNTLFVMTHKAFVRLDHETVCVEIEREVRLQVPLHHLGAITVFGNVMLSPGILSKCAEDGRTVTWLSSTGRFVGRLEGPVSGNVLLRKAQWQAALNEASALEIARNLVAGKIRNGRTSLLRSAREAGEESEKSDLNRAAAAMAGALRELPRCTSLDSLRGHEGEAAHAYFSAFTLMLKAQREVFRFTGRSRRPPRDPVNALLSFLYALLLSDCAGAAQGVGLDSQAGFLHALRPGRPALALDLMEDLRPFPADRLAITMINRRQIVEKDFDRREGGAVYLNEGGRKKVVAAYQERKQERLTHLFLERDVPLGLLPHLQARLLARTLRGDQESYPPFLWK